MLDEVNGADGAFRDWKVSHHSSPLSTTYSVTGTVDLAKGMETFTDPALDQTLGGKPFGGAIEQIEKDQGRPISDMVDVQVSVEVPGASRTYTPTLGDADATHVAVSSSQTGVVVSVLAVLVGLGVVIAAGLLVRRRFAHQRSRSPRRA